MVSPSVGGFGSSTQPPTMIRLFAELSGHYLPWETSVKRGSGVIWVEFAFFV